MEKDRGNIALYSTLRANGDVEIAFRTEDMPESAADELIVEMRAAPINPTDMFLMGALADPATAVRAERDGKPITLLRAPDWAAQALAARWDQPMAVGSEGAGRVVAAGSGPAAQALLGRDVALWGSGTYARYCKVRAGDALLLPDDVSPAEGAAAFINPMTALGMVETMRRDGFSGLLHTAAASSLGQMLCRICEKEGIGLVSIVRNARQVELLKSIGAQFVCDSSAQDFDQALQDAVRSTGARLGFDATGGGTLVSQILAAMERVDMEGQGYRPYGAARRKKVYIYGGLDPSPLQMLRNYGLSWETGGWLVYNFIEEAGQDVADRLKRRIAAELKTTFAVTYNRTIGLEDICDPEVIRGVNERATGGKYLLDFTR